MQMNVYEAIAHRKTIRDFAQQQIPQEVLKRILAAGMQAPSNDHMRSWHFVLLYDRNKRQALLQQVITPVGIEKAKEILDDWEMTDPVQREMYMEGIPKQFSMLMGCDVLVIPCYLQDTPLLQPENLSALNAFVSIWCCIENILVAAAGEGIFGVTRIPGEKERAVMKEFLDIPDGYEIPCHLALGYPAEGAKRARQLEINLDERTHTDEW